jgi:ribonuclease P protein component
MHKENRLQKNEHFKKVFKWGKSVANRQLVLYYYLNREVKDFRLGISVSKKIGHAVTRNRIKRLLKEVVRTQEDHISTGYDLVIIVRKPAADMGYDDFTSSFIHLLKRAKLYK